MISNSSRKRRKETSVIPIDSIASKKSGGPRRIASDPATRRIIVAMGGERYAYDFTTRITQLATTTGDDPAPVIPLRDPIVKKRPPKNGNQGPRR